ncbi:MAG: putative RNA uridine N3 methyltransferase [Halobacteriaceae archaeon]
MTTSLLVPSSLCREVGDKREATRKLGTVARAAAVFRVDRLVVFPDPPGERRWGGGFVTTVLRYAATPPHLRKEAFGPRDELEYAGVLPPLRVPSWTGSESNDSGSLRDGIVTQVGPEGRVRVTCGLQHPLSLRVPDGMSVTEGERVTVRVSSRRPVRARLVDEPTPGLRVVRQDLDAALASDDAGLRIATSRHAPPLTLERLPGLCGTVEREGCTVAFGAPERGLPELLGVDTDALGTADGDDGGVATARDAGDGATDDHDEEDETAGGTARRGRAPGGFDAWLNTIPDQGSEVVRTEEAVLATLAPLNIR